MKKVVLAEYEDSYGDTYIAYFPVHGNSYYPKSIAQKHCPPGMRLKSADFDFDPDNLNEGPDIPRLASYAYSNVCFEI